MIFLFLVVRFTALICAINAHILLSFFCEKLISISQQRYNIKTLLSRVLKNIFMTDVQQFLQNALTIRP